MNYRCFILLLISAGCLCTSCLNRQKGTVIGGADGPTSIFINEEVQRADSDSVVYAIPQCELRQMKAGESDDDMQ